MTLTEKLAWQQEVQDGYTLPSLHHAVIRNNFFIDTRNADFSSFLFVHASFAHGQISSYRVGFVAAGRWIATFPTLEEALEHGYSIYPQDRM